MSAYAAEFGKSLKACATLVNKAEAATSNELKEKLKKSYSTFHRKLLVLVSKHTLPAPSGKDRTATEALDNG
jgi:predicted HTH transcriptional regulator